jgi:hypothetical protein
MLGQRHLLVRTRAQLDERLRAFRYTPAWDGIYPFHSILCGDGVWKLAIDSFMAHADLVAMNLCGFSRSNQGCVYELGLLTDRMPTDRVLYLIDDSTDLDFLLETLQQTWDTMPTASPNHIECPAPVTFYKIRLSNPDDMQNMVRLFFKMASQPAAHHDIVQSS